MTITNETLQQAFGGFAGISKTAPVTQEIDLHGVASSLVDGLAKCATGEGDPEEKLAALETQVGGIDSLLSKAVEDKDGKVTVAMTDFDVDPFDVTVPRNIDTDLPLDERVPGGLGLHLVQQMVDNLEYEYRDRQSTIRFTKESG